MILCRVLAQMTTTFAIHKLIMQFWSYKKMLKLRVFIKFFSLGFYIYSKKEKKLPKRQRESLMQVFSVFSSFY